MRATPENVAERFWAKVDFDGPIHPELGNCWIWTAGVSGGSVKYGSFQPYNGAKRTTAHRIAFELAGGVIPEGHQIHHQCEQPLCVRPDHLVALKPYENNMLSKSRASLKAKQTMCGRGLHPLEGENLMVDGNGWRRCRTCWKAYTREYAKRPERRAYNVAWMRRKRAHDRGN